MRNRVKGQFILKNVSLLVVRIREGDYFFFFFLQSFTDGQGLLRQDIKYDYSYGQYSFSNYNK